MLPYFNVPEVSLHRIECFEKCCTIITMAHLGQLADESEIKSLLTRERYYRDTAQWEELRRCYHPDAGQTKIDISW